MKQISSHMAGVVIDILVDLGDSISSGMEIAILESMKMQLPIEAEIEGIVKEIQVSKGDFVNEGEPVLILE